MKELGNVANKALAIIGCVALIIWCVDWVKDRGNNKPEMELRKSVNVRDSLFTDDSIYIVTKRLDTVIANDDENYRKQKWEDGSDDRR